MKGSTEIRENKTYKRPSLAYDTKASFAKRERVELKLHSPKFIVNNAVYSFGHGREILCSNPEMGEGLSSFIASSTESHQWI